MPVTTGIRVWGDHGLFQIDGNNYCMSVLGHGTLLGALVTNEPDFGFGTLYRITFVGDTPVFGLYLPESENAVGGVYSTSQSGSTWTVWFAISQAAGGGPDVNPANVHWFAFDRPKVISGPGAGLRVWNDAGLMVFDSNWKTVVPERTPVTGRKYAFVGGSVGFAMNLDVDVITVGEYVYHARYYGYGAYSFDGGVASAEITIADEGGSGTGGGSTGYTRRGTSTPLLPIDVTGYV